MIIVPVPRGTKLPLETLIGSTAGRMQSSRDPETGLTTIARGPNVEPPEEVVVFKLALDLADHVEDTPCVDGDSQCAMMADVRTIMAGGYDRAAARRLASKTRTMLDDVARVGMPYEHAERLQKAIDAVLPRVDDAST